MPFIFSYILKLSICLAVVFLFYYFILRKLTFYNWNRYYLFIYTLLSFYIPLIDVSAMLQQSDLQSAKLLQWVPAMGDYQYVTNGASAATLSINNIIMLLLMAGMLVTLVRLCVQFISFRQLKKKALPVYSDEMKLYQVDANIIPFSFGNAIFINPRLHSQAELQDIIRHEFVHVKQQHSIDIIWSELLCVINWYNPFVWLIKKAIRQNLEFIADDKVLQNGLSKKEYQYLLLKVTGNNQFSIAAPFNFSSLKKRIAMMNKMKSAKLHLIKFLFLLPLITVLLLAFRNEWKAPAAVVNSQQKVSIAGLVVDASTRQPLANATVYCSEKNVQVQTDSRGYYLLQLLCDNKELQFSLQVSKDGYTSLLQQEHWGNFSSDHIFKLYGHTFEFFGLDKKSPGFSAIGGNAASVEQLGYDQARQLFETIPKQMNNSLSSKLDTVPGVTTPNNKGYFIDILNNKGNCTIVIKDKNKTEVKRMLLTEWNKKEDYYEGLYGEIPPPPPPPVAPVPPVPPAEPLPSLPPMAPLAPEAPLPPAPPLPPVLPENVSSLHVDNDKATVRLKNGKKEVYDLTVPEQKEKFERKYRSATTTKKLDPAEPF